MVAKVETLAGSILEAQHLELVELAVRPQGRQLMVRLLVDAPGGVTIQQCATVNQRLGQALEEAAVIEDPYTIEVSSPGLDRPLKTARDFERAIGEQVRLEAVTPDGRTRTIEGMVLAVQPAAVVVKTREGNLTVPLPDIRIAKKALKW